jgi:hypothetical protein
MKNPQPSLMVHTNPEIETSNLILDFEFDQHLGSHKHVINIIMLFRDMGCYRNPLGASKMPHQLRQVLQLHWQPKSLGMETVLLTDLKCDALAGRINR